MQNPYASPTAIRNESGVGQRITLNPRPRLLRTAVCGIVGYFAPFAVLIPVYALQFGWHPIGEQFDGLADWHWPITLTGWALLIPNLFCLVLFGAAGCAKSSRHTPSPVFVRWLTMGVATLIGYAAMLGIIFVFDPWPGSWSAERTNLTQSGIALIPPVALSLCWLVARRQRRTKR